MYWGLFLWLSKWQCQHLLWDFVNIWQTCITKLLCAMSWSQPVITAFLGHLHRSFSVGGIFLWSQLGQNFCISWFTNPLPGSVAQSVTCLATDACLTADPGVASSIPVRSHTFVEIDHEIISTVILLPSADLFKKGCCQLQAKVCAQITG